MISVKKIAEELVEKTKNVSKKEQEKIIRSTIFSLGSRGLSKYFSKLVNEIEKLSAKSYQLKATLETAHQLDKKSLDMIEKELKAVYGEIQYSVVENKELIGGVRIKIGDTVIDASLKNRLKKLQMQVTCNS